MDKFAEPGSEGAGGISRRTLLGTGALAMAIAGLGVDPFAPAASATVAWNHPFVTRRSVPPDGEYNNYALWRQQQGLGRHTGVDLNGTYGMAVYCCAVGTVTWAGWGNGQPSWGRWVEIQHSDGTKTGYSHLSEALVTTDQVLNSTTAIGRVGGSGSGGETTYAPHLHLTHYTGTIATRHDPTFLVNDAPLAQPGASTPGQLNQEDDMRMIQAPNGSLAIISAYYAAEYGGGDTIGVSANLNAWGPLIPVSAAEYDRLISDANGRRAALLADLAAQA